MDVIFEENREIFENVSPMLTEKRLKHTEGVRDEAVRLAKIYGADPVKAELAALCHDMFRGKDIEYLNELVQKYSLPDKYLNNSNLSHGKLAAYCMSEDMGIEDMDVINAVSYHTTGRRNMSTLEKIVFIADAVEPGRDYDGVKEIRERVYKDIDGACLLSLKGTLNHLLNSGMKIEEVDEDTLAAIEDLENK